MDNLGHCRARWVALLLGFALGAVLPAGIAPSPAAAGGQGAVTAALPSQAPGVGIRVTPAGDLVDGQVVEVEVTGLSGDLWIGQCDATLVPGNTVHCRYQDVSSDGGVVTVPFTVLEEYDTNYRGQVRHTRCGGVVDDCLIVVSEAGRAPVATTPIHFKVPDAAVTVTPSSGLHDGDPVQVEVTGLRSDSLVVAQCQSDVAATLRENLDLISTACLPFGMPGGPPGPSVVVPGTISEAWAWDGPDGIEASHCGPEPGGCVIVAYGYERDMLLTVPIEVEPSTLAVAPGDQEAGFPVHVFVSGRPGATVRIAQCATPVRATARASRCARARQLTLDQTGDAASTLTLVERIASRHRRSPCTSGGCAVAVFDVHGLTLSSSPLVVYAPDGPPALSVTPHVDLFERQSVEVAITGARNTGLRWLGQCDAAVVTLGHTDPALCRLPWEVVLGHDDPELRTEETVTRFLETADGSTLRCGLEPGDCVIAVATDAGQLLWVPLSFGPPPVATLAPASGLLDDQPMTFDVTGLPPGATYVVERCNGAVGAARTCEWTDIWVVASPQGRITTTVPARQLFTWAGDDGAYCRQQCHVGLVGEPTTLMPYAMAEGRLAASPREGLADRQLVTVNGTDLMPSYSVLVSPPFVRMGAWGMMQCGRAVADDRTIAGIYRHCTVPPGGGIVDVPGSELSVELEVRATFDSLTSDPVDCTAAADACLLALARVELDGTLSLITTPIGFATR